MKQVVISGTASQISGQLAMLADIEAEFEAACAEAEPVWYLGAGAQYQTPLDAYLAYALGARRAENASPACVRAHEAELTALMQKGANLRHICRMAMGVL